jgi:hypothetical protein
MSYVHTIESRGPIVAKESVKVVRLIDVSGGLLIFQNVVFETEISWLRESEASLKLIDRNGRLVELRATHHDAYGFLSSLSEITYNAYAWAQNIGLDKEGPFEICIGLTVTDSPVTLSGRAASFGRTSYSSLPSDWRRATHGDPALLNEPDATDANLICTKTIVSEVIWSSRKGQTTAEQFPHFGNVIDRALIGLSAEVAAQVRSKTLATIYAEAPAQ